MSEQTGTKTDGEEKEPIKVTFSIPQIIGGALAAATAAAIGSQLGVAGTIVGAAVASMIGGVAGTVYSAGLDRTHRRMKEVIARTTGRAETDEPTDEENAATAEGMPEAPEVDELAATLVDLPAVSLATDAERHAYRLRLWKRTALTALAMFVLAVATITAIELSLGRSLDGTGSTTVGQATRPQQPNSQPTATVTHTVVPSPSARSERPTPTPAPSPSQAPTPTPVPSPSTPEAPTPAAPPS